MGGLKSTRELAHTPPPRASTEGVLSSLNCHTSALISSISLNDGKGIKAMHTGSARRIVRSGGVGVKLCAPSLTLGAASLTHASPPPDHSTINTGKLGEIIFGGEKYPNGYGSPPSEAAPLQLRTCVIICRVYPHLCLAWIVTSAPFAQIPLL